MNIINSLNTRIGTVKGLIGKIVYIIYHNKYVHPIASKLRFYISEANKNRSTKHIEISIPELFFQQNTATGYNRYDTIVRLLAVENYFGLNDYGFDLYRRMQAERCGDTYADEAVAKYKDLIASFEKNGYDQSSEILLDKDLHLLDGSHRLALALFFNIKKIKAIVRKERENVYYGMEWFKINGFNEDERTIIKSRLEALKSKLNVPFVCTIWNPANKYYTDITDNLALFGKVEDIKDYELTENEYKFYTRMIYAVDDIAKWKIEKKIQYMTSIKQDRYTIRKVSLVLDKPVFRLKYGTNSTLSTTCELIKQLIRDGYRKKIINYFHDIIIHIGDNFYQNAYINHFLELPTIDVTKFFKEIYSQDYVIVKHDVPYMPEDFPAHIPYGKDVDIVCKDKETYMTIMNILKYFTKQYENDYEIKSIEYRNSENIDYRTLVRFELEKQLILQFDISYKYHLEYNIEKELISEPIDNGLFKVPAKSREILIRLLELKEKPEKTYHRDYVIENRDYIDEILLNKYLDFDWQKLIR